MLGTERRRLVAGARIEPTMALAFEVQASRDVYVYIVNEDEHGRSYGLFPVANTPAEPAARRRHARAAGRSTVGGGLDRRAGAPVRDRRARRPCPRSPTRSRRCRRRPANRSPTATSPSTPAESARAGAPRRRTRRTRGASRRSRCCPGASGRRPLGPRIHPQEPLTATFPRAGEPLRGTAAGSRRVQIHRTRRYRPLSRFSAAGARRPNAGARMAECSD